jgi:hypothetical protein
MKKQSDEELYGGMSPDEDVLTEEEKAELIREAEAENIKRLKEVDFHGFI